MKQNRPVTIILTGSIATGKSTVAAIIKENGYKLLDSDKIVHELYGKNKIVYKEVVRHFGQKILDQDGEIERKKLGSIIFNNDEKREKLNNIVHKGVLEALIKGIEKCDDNIIFLDIPLFIEEEENLRELGLKYDAIWLVYVNEKLQLQRLLKRDNRGEIASKDIINSQKSIEEKVKFADVVINNEGTKEDLKQTVLELLKTTNASINKKN